MCGRIYWRVRHRLKRKTPEADSTMVSHLPLFFQNHWNVCIHSNGGVNDFATSKTHFNTKLRYGITPSTNDSISSSFSNIDPLVAFCIEVWWFELHDITQLKPRSISNRTISIFAQSCRCCLKPFSHLISDKILFGYRIEEKKNPYSNCIDFYLKCVKWETRVVDEFVIRLNDKNSRVTLHIGRWWEIDRMELLRWIRCTNTRMWAHISSMLIVYMNELNWPSVGSELTKNGKIADSLNAGPHTISISKNWCP